MPEWLAVVQSALLNESATLFRRRYYTNGLHAGFILYMTDPQRRAWTWMRCVRRCETRVAG